MANVRFIKDFDFRLTKTRIKAYRAGFEGSVLRRCADEAISAGAAVPIRLPRKPRLDVKP